MVLFADSFTCFVVCHNREARHRSSHLAVICAITKRCRYCHCIYDSKEQASLAIEKLNDQPFPGSDSKVGHGNMLSMELGDWH